MDYKNKNGFTLIELVMVIVIIGILAISGAYVMLYVIQGSVFTPNQLNMDMVAEDAVNLMIDGDGQARGLRFSRELTVLQDYLCAFISQSGNTVTYRLDTGTSKLYRSINGGAEAVIPSYVTSGINMLGQSNKLFTYYDANEAITSVPADVRWVTLTLIARTGSGSFNEWQGESMQNSSVAVRKYQ